MMAEKKTKETKAVKAPAAKEAKPTAAPAAKTPAGVATRVATDGHIVKVHYKGTLKDGTVFDSSEGRDPISFTLGGHQVVPGFEDAVRGMRVGEKKSVTVPPAQAYGDQNQQLFQKVPLAALKESGITPEKGMVLGLRHPQRPEMQIPATIISVDEEFVIIDLNHPLAGKELTFEVELVSVE